MAKALLYPRILGTSITTTRLFLIYQENQLGMTLDQYCYYHIYLIGALCKLDELTIQENIHSAFRFADAHELEVDSIFQ